MKIALIILSLVIYVTPAFADEVIRIVDGDTLMVLSNGAPLKIRLANINAPEMSMAFGEKSKQSLSELCYRKDAVYSVQSIDRYGRSVANVMCAGVDVSRAQVELGMARIYTRYNKDQSLIAIQAQAKAARRGLWIEETAFERLTRVLRTFSH